MPESESKWGSLVRRARSDAGPPADLAAILRAIRQAPAAARPGWLGEFSSLFASGRALAACLAGAGACALVASWQIWEVWQALPWAQLLDTVTGGGS